MKNKKFVIRQMVDNKQDKRLQPRRAILLPEHTSRIDLVYDEQGNIEFLDIEYQKRAPFEL